MKRILTIISSLLLLAACTSDWQPKGKESLAVEGWIESGGYPVVMVTTSAATDTEYRSLEDLSEHLVRWAKVSIDDGDNEVVLTGMKNTRYVPPYIYTSSKMKGETGKTYKLKVEYSGHTVTAETVIPAPVPLEGIESVREGAPDGYAKLRASFTDPAGSKDYYKLFVKVEKTDSTYLPSFLGNFDDEVFDGKSEIGVLRGRDVRGIQDEDNIWDASLFKIGSDVKIKFCTMDEASFKFWDSFESVATMSASPLFAVTYNPAFNITGAYGYWCGYGVSEYSLIVK